MAAATVLGGGTLHHRCQCLTLPTKPYSRPSKLLYSTIIHYQPSKIRAFSVRACGRADNDKLSPSDVRKRPIYGIDFSGRRVSIGDASSFKSNQAQKLFGIKIESVFEKGKMAMLYLMRVSFWVSFVASGSVLLTGAACFIIMTGIFNVERAVEEMVHIRNATFKLFDAKFIECVFSYAFGDGDPNQGIEEKRWKMIGLYIALNGSVVTAEEIAPYLDKETTGKMDDDDDSYMLPVLRKFDGQPKVDEGGNILYHFPSVYCTPLPRTSSREKKYAGRWVDRDMKVDKFLVEHQWKFSKFDDSSVDYVASRPCSLLIFNVLLGFVSWVTLDCGSYFLTALHLMFAIYAVSFMVISSIRRSYIKKRNAEIVKRNEARKERAESLESPDICLMRKLSSARTMARRASIGNDRIVYGSESDLYEQQDYERREWDQRLGFNSSGI